MGWALCLEDWTIDCKGSASRTFVGSVLVAEALALKEAFQMAVNADFKSLQFFLELSVLIYTRDQGWSKMRSHAFYKTQGTLQLSSLSYLLNLFLVLKTC